MDRTARLNLGNALEGDETGTVLCLDALGKGKEILQVMGLSDQQDGGAEISYRK